MSLILHSHPLSSFCQKVLVALYENDTRFEARLVDLADEQSRKAFTELWPMAKMPVLRDEARDRTIPESTIIIEYLQQHYPGQVPLIASDPGQALEIRLQDRFCDFYLEQPVQKIVFDRLRPAGEHDTSGVDLARAMLRNAYAVLERTLQNRTWVAGEAFSMADCGAAPALFYADKVQPLAGHPQLQRYFGRLMHRPSFARVVEEAQPWFKLFPQE